MSREEESEPPRLASVLDGTTNTGGATTTTTTTKGGVAKLKFRPNLAAANQVRPVVCDKPSSVQEAIPQLARPRGPRPPRPPRPAVSDDSAGGIFAYGLNIPTTRSSASSTSTVSSASVMDRSASNEASGASPRQRRRPPARAEPSGTDDLAVKPMGDFFGRSPSAALPLVIEAMGEDDSKAMMDDADGEDRMEDAIPGEGEFFLLQLPAPLTADVRAELDADGRLCLWGLSECERLQVVSMPTGQPVLAVDLNSSTSEAKVVARPVERLYAGRMLIGSLADQ